MFRFLPWWVRPGRDTAWYAATEADAIDATLMKQEYPPRQRKRLKLLRSAHSSLHRAMGRLPRRRAPA